MTENEPETQDETHTVNGISGDQLQSIVERIENVIEHKAELQDDITQIYAEAKGNGFEVKAIRKIIKIRAMDETERNEQEEILAIYMRALGMEA